MFLLNDGSKIALSSLSEKRIIDIEDVRGRDEFVGLNGRFANINYANLRWQASLVVRSMSAGDADIMETLAEAKDFTILANNLAPIGASHSFLPVIAGGKVFVAGNLTYQTSGRAANQSPYTMSLPLLLLAEPPPLAAIESLPGESFNIEKEDGSKISFGFDGELSINILERAKERTNLNFIDGSYEKIEFNRERRTSLRFNLTTTNPDVVNMVEILRDAERWTLCPSEYAAKNVPGGKLDGLDPDFNLECEIVGGISIRPADNNYVTGAYQITFIAYGFGRIDVNVEEELALFREFIEFMSADSTYAVRGQV